VSDETCLGLSVSLYLRLLVYLVIYDLSIWNQQVRCWSENRATFDQDETWEVLVARAPQPAQRKMDFLRILVCLVIYDSGWVSLEHLLLSWYPSYTTVLGDI
jgi:hypothetical protein